MTRFSYILLLFSTLFGVFSCNKTGSEPVSVVPENLTLTVDNLNDGSGQIIVTAKADNAFSYELYPNEKNGADPVVDKSGNLEYRYSTSGDYTIEVRAVGNAGDYISDTEDISVNVDGSLIIPSTGYTTPESYAGMTLIWQDEFSGETVDNSNWTFEIGRGSNGWGNNELQYYTEDNAYILNDYLVIEAKEEPFNGSAYTSSRMITQNKFDFTYGRVDIRAALPYGQGIWPALWMLGDNISTVGWPQCGEVDVMELIGGGEGRDDTVYGTLHWDDNGHVCTCDQGTDYTISSGIFADEFHVFTISWDANTIQWYVDDVPYKTVDITPAELSEFHKNFFFIFNVAVGGNWPGNPDASTQFPQRMIVDYVRVFQDN